MRYLTKFVVSSFLLFASVGAEEEKTHDIMMQIKINCPASDEFAAFVQSIPQPGYSATSFEEWKASFVANMTQLIALVESEKVYSATWGVDTQEHVPQETEEN